MSVVQTRTLCERCGENAATEVVVMVNEDVPEQQLYVCEDCAVVLT